MWLTHCCCSFDLGELDFWWCLHFQVQPHQVHHTGTCLHLCWVQVVIILNWLPVQKLVAKCLAQVQCSYWTRLLTTTSPNGIGNKWEALNRQQYPPFLRLDLIHDRNNKTSVNTPGEPLLDKGLILLLFQLRPQPLPHDVTPTATQHPSALGQRRGPPESPWST